MFSRSLAVCVVVAAFPAGWFALRAALPAPAPHAGCAHERAPEARESGEAPRLAPGEIDRRLSDAMPWLLPLRRNRAAYSVDIRALDDEAVRLWSEAEERVLSEDERAAVLAELDLRLRAANSFAASVRPAEHGVEGERLADVAELAPREADHALLSFASGSWRAIALDEVPRELQSGPRAGMLFVAHLSASLQTLLLFPIDPTVDRDLHARKTAALARGAALAAR